MSAEISAFKPGLRYSVAPSPLLQFVDLRDRPEALAQVARWHQQCWRHVGNYVDLRQRQAKLAQHVESQSLPTTWLAVQDNVPVGSVSLVQYTYSKPPLADPSFTDRTSTNRSLADHSSADHSYAYNGRNQVWLSNLYVHPTQRRRGIGSALVSHAVRRASALNLGKLYLFTADAAAFYQQQGWRWQQRLRVQRQWVDILSLSLPC